MLRPLPSTKWLDSAAAFGNAALWYEKLGGDWMAGWSLKASSEGGPKLDWIRSVAEGEKAGDDGLLKEHADRQEKLAAARGGRVLALQNRSVFVTGLGEAHPIENGFAWHPLLGVPYLPGSGVKGALRTWLETDGPELVAQAAELDDAVTAGAEPDLPGESEIDRLLGSPSEGVGAIDFLALLPTTPVRLQADLVNPHHVPYQRGKEWPADWQNPVPSFFLAVAPSNRWQLAVVPRPGLAEADDVARVVAWLLQAAEWLGFGAKTASGYGRFRPAPEPKGKKGKAKAGR